MKILAICPTIYAEKFEKMHESFKKTVSPNTELFVLNKKGCITKFINEAFEQNNDYDFYFLINDDIIFQTPLWDEKLANKGKISYGDDHFQGQHMPTFPMIDGDIARSVGWLHMPKLNRYCGDLVWKFIGEQLEILTYCPEVVIEHKWEGCAEPLVNELDMAEFAGWLPRSHKDINKIKEIL